MPSNKDTSQQSALVHGLGFLKFVKHVADLEEEKRFFQHFTLKGDLKLFLLQIQSTSNF